MSQHIKKFLDTIVSPDDNWKLNLLCNWRQIIGKLYEKVTIEKIHDKTIVLGVHDSCWMQELYMLSPLLIKTINERLDQPRIKQVRFKQTGKKKPKPKKQTQRRQQKRTNVCLTATEQKILDRINDPTLRHALKAFRIRCYQESE